MEGFGVLLGRRRVKAALAGSGRSVRSLCLSYGEVVGYWGCPSLLLGGPRPQPPPPPPVLSSCTTTPQPLLRRLLRAPGQQRGLIKGSLDLGAPAPRHPLCLSLGKIKWEGAGGGEP